MEPCRYFIAKVASIASLQRCADSGIWACRDRVTPPHPREVLSSAFKTSKVILIFSVNNCHGWHGYAEMLEAPKLDRSCEINDSTDRGDTLNHGHVTTKHTVDNGGEISSDIKHADELDNELVIAPGIKQATGEFINERLTETLLACKVHKPNKSFGSLTDSSQCTCNKNVSKIVGCPLLEFEREDETGSERISDQRKQKLDRNLDTQSSADVWYHFPVKWKVCFIKEFGEQCMSSKLTEHLKASDTMYLNKARNWQEVAPGVGETVCSLMDKFYGSLCEKRQIQAQKLLDNQADPFFKVEEEQLVSCEKTWRKIVEKIEAELGPVILACPFGSQRYNLSVPDSDTDMFIVYQARTRDLLGFHPPKQTIKNNEKESCDYTIHEAYRYAELLLSGDARCVETLFLDESTLVKSSQQWEKLRAGRHHFLNQETLHKYLRDAQGTRGTKQLKKWCDENPAVDVLLKKICKLLYVIVRLLQNARDIVQGKELCVFRGNNSTDRNTLMKIRQGNITVSNAWEIIGSLESEIEENKHKVPEKHKDTEIFLEDWLLSLRKKDFFDQTL